MCESIGFLVASVCMLLSSSRKLGSLMDMDSLLDDVLITH